MLTAHSRASVSVLFRDRGGNERRTSLSFPFSISDSALETVMAYWIERVTPLTNAGIFSWTVSRTFESEIDLTVGEDVELFYKLALYYVKEAIYEAIWIPSPRMDLFELEGPYAGIRLDSARPEVAALLLAWQDVITFIVTPEGDPFPDTFAAGGLAK